MIYVHVFISVLFLYTVVKQIQNLIQMRKHLLKGKWTGWS